VAIRPRRSFIVSVSSSPLGPLARRGRQHRLADPRFAGDQQDAAGAGRRGGAVAFELLPLWLALE
jgi:hypothetical protein